ncbi:hypothetical protein [Sandarakinorhabdus sp.]|uniref:hypothetical protein n=1 Tax=Sandarakinorhabdus sp. TaxID=1916663 RepID=UPI0033400136
MIASPLYGGLCTVQYVEGLLQTIGSMQARGIPLYWCHLSNESLITRARNELARLFLASDYSHLMFIDADMVFDGDAVAALLAADADIVCGIAPKRELDWPRVERAAAAGQTGLQDYAGSFVFNLLDENAAQPDARGRIEVRHGGTGFMMINRRVFETLQPHVPSYRVSTMRDAATGEYLKPLTHEFFATSIDETGALLSEDYHFCALWRRHGGSVHAQPFVKLAHVGNYVYAGDLIKAGGNVK